MLFDGSRFMLKNVRHVPQIKKNLISTGLLDDDGFHTTFGDAKWKFTKGSMVIARDGGEYMSRAFQDFCDNRGINRELTAPYDPPQNGVAERMNRTIQEKV